MYVYICIIYIYMYMYIFEIKIDRIWHIAKLIIIPGWPLGAPRESLQNDGLQSATRPAKRQSLRKHGLLKPQTWTFRFFQVFKVPDLVSCFTIYMIYVSLLEFTVWIYVLLYVASFGWFCPDLNRSNILEIVTTWMDENYWPHVGIVLHLTSK